MFEYTPPPHAVDDKSTWISPIDPAWNRELLTAEREALGEAAVAKMPEDASDTAKKLARDKAMNDGHPLDRWYKAETRFSLLAPLPGSEKTIQDYLTGTPSTFEIRRLKAREYNVVYGLMTSDDPNWPYKAAQLGLREIHDFPGLEVKRDKHKLVTDETLEALHRVHVTLVRGLGLAVWNLTRRGTADEGKL